MLDTKPRVVGEVFFVLLLLAVSLFLLWSAYTISGFESFASAGAVPMAAAGLMAVCALVILVQTLRRPPGEPEAGLVRRLMVQVTPPALLFMLVLIVLYVVLLEQLGFLLVSFLFLYASMFVLGSFRWFLNLVVSVGTLVVIYIVFEELFSVVLPGGRLWQGVFQ